MAVTLFTRTNKTHIIINWVVFGLLCAILLFELVRCVEFDFDFRIHELVSAFGGGFFTMGVFSVISPIPSTEKLITQYVKHLSRNEQRNNEGGA
jgi:uncharacterized membrane protein